MIPQSTSTTETTMSNETHLTMTIISNSPGHEAWGATCPVCQCGQVIHYPGTSLEDIETAECRRCGTNFEIVDHAIVGAV